MLALKNSAQGKQEHASAVVDHIEATGHTIKWDHFEILASVETDFPCKIKTEINPTLNANLTSDKLSL